MNKKVLVIAAHPDDELLGCAGTIALHIQSGDIVESIIACEGESLRNVEQRDNSEHHAEKAAKVLGVQNVHMLGFPDQKLETLILTDIISPIEKIVNEFKPEIIYCQFGGDINRDHELLFKALMVAVRPTVEHIEAVYAFDTASSTEWAFPRTFIPDTWVDISSVLNMKLKAMECYQSELRDYPHPRSLLGLKNKAAAWGNQACMGSAEVFMTIRRSYRDGKTPS
jgi:LmbE family N-acetylglucosaminyl deacetylase